MKSILLFILVGSFLSSTGQAKEPIAKEFVIENLSVEKSCQLKYELLMSNKDELMSKGWTQEQLKERAYANCNASSMDYLQKMVNKFRKKGLNIRLVNEGSLVPMTSQHEYLIKVNYQLDITKKGMFSIGPVFNVFDSSGKLMFTESSDRLFKKLVSI